jgi:hypothetical protein
VPAATAQAPPRQRKPSQAQLIAAIIPVLAGAVTVAGAVAALGTLMAAAGVGYLALAAAVRLVMAWPQAVTEGTGPASRWAVRASTLRRAQFFLSAAQRVQQAATAAQSRGLPVAEAVQAAAAAEQRYLAQHAAASQQRMLAGSRVDSAASLYGPLLGWQAVTDAACTPGCRAASGSNFRAARPPVVEGHPAYPGMVHGATCRCIPVRPFRGAAILPSAGEAA